jgi:diol dehydratase reactivase alpha subunit
MKLIAGVDIGNSTTEACIAEVGTKGICFVSSALAKTTGVKGTIENVKGIVEVITEALKQIGKKPEDLQELRINEAAPVISDTAMETITETIITDSAMIGHNPSTPGGVGIGIGETIHIKDIEDCKNSGSYIVVIPKEVDFEKAADTINWYLKNGVNMCGAIVEKDEAVLINNRLIKTIPIVDEVQHIDKVPLGARGAVEVAQSGYSVKALSNPYDIASIFSLKAEETRRIVPVAKSLIGLRSAVVIKTPEGQVKEKVIPAGQLYIKGRHREVKVNIDSGAEEIMKHLYDIQDLEDVAGEAGTNIGLMITAIKASMAELIGEEAGSIKIKDILAMDTFLPVRVQGGLAGESIMENAVAVAAMVKTQRLPIEKIATELNRSLGIKVEIAGVEAVMAALGALTTPGVKLPIAILDLGGGSTDAALLDEKGQIKSVHLAGAGELVTMLINSELGLGDKSLAEDIKINPVAKVESLFHIRMENREVKFYTEPLNPKYFGRVVVMKEELLPIPKDISLEKIAGVRREAKKKVFIENAIRALKTIAPENNIRNIPNVILVGGSALDYEIPEMLLEELSKYKIVAGRGNIRRTQGPRNAVATGLVMSYVNR